MKDCLQCAGPDFRFQTTRFLKLQVDIKKKTRKFTGPPRLALVTCGPVQLRKVKIIVDVSARVFQGMRLPFFAIGQTYLRKKMRGRCEPET